LDDWEGNSICGFFPKEKHLTIKGSLEKITSFCRKVFKFDGIFQKNLQRGSFDGLPTTQFYHEISKIDSANTENQSYR
jgi:hypothetical protein